MKFKDLPKFTNAGKYQIHVTLIDLVRTIDNYIAKDNLEINPDFQRGHVWTEQQQIAFMEYIFKGGTANLTLYFNHPGWMKDWKGKMVLVDGLQRLTACLNFLNNKIKIFGYFFNEFEDRLHSNYYLIFNVNDLETRKETLNWYLEMNTGGTVHSEEAIDKVKKLLEKEKG